MSGKKILVTGGLGYIGSHTVVCLQEAGFEVLVVDDCSNSSEKVLDGIAAISGKKPHFTNLDLRDKEATVAYFESHSNIDGVIHFAASKAVSESVADPLKYYENNIAGLVYVLQACVKHQIYNFIFSSSCTVYGEPDSLPIDESAPVKPATSPYGNTKQVGEEIILESCKAYGLHAISLRYFNPIGAHDSAEIGELPLGVPQNLVPFITQTAAGIRKELQVFGDDYPTPDGSCIRDYIHVVDIAEAHMVALYRLLEQKNHSDYEVFNLGTGAGSSVFDIIKTFEKVSGQALPHKISNRRAGDIISVYADTKKANEVLGWKARFNNEDALGSAWKWEQKIRSKS